MNFLKISKPAGIWWGTPFLGNSSWGALLFFYQNVLNEKSMCHILLRSLLYSYVVLSYIIRNCSDIKTKTLTFFISSFFLKESVTQNTKVVALSWWRHHSPGMMRLTHAQWTTDVLQKWTMRMWTRYLRRLWLVCGILGPIIVDK